MKENGSEGLISTPGITPRFEIVSVFTTAYPTQSSIFHMENCSHQQDMINVMAPAKEQKLFFLSHAWIHKDFKYMVLLFTSLSVLYSK